MTRSRTLAAALTGVLAVSVAGCSTGPGDNVSCGGGHATVSLLDVRSGATLWQARTDAPTEEPGVVGSGAVLLREECGATVLRLTDGRRLFAGRTEAPAVGVADDQLFVLDRDASEVRGVPLAGGHRRSSSTLPDDEEVDAAVVAGRPVTVSGRNLTVGLDHGWTATLPSLSSPVFARAAGRLLVASTDGTFYGLDAGDGSHPWRVSSPLATGMSPARVQVAGETVLLTTGDEDLTSGTWTARVDPSDGRVLWSRTGWTVAAAGDDIVVLGRRRGRMAVDARTGRVLWRRPVGGTAAVVRDVVALPGFETVSGYDARGRRLWTDRPLRAHRMMGVDGRLLVVGDDSVTALDPRTGRQLWRVATTHPPTFAPAGSGRVVVVDSDPVPHFVE